MIVFEYADPVCVSLLFVERVGRSPGSIFCSISLEVSWHSFSKEFPHVSSVSIFEGSIPLFLKAFRALCCLKSGVVPFFQKNKRRKTSKDRYALERHPQVCQVLLKAPFPHSLSASLGSKRHTQRTLSPKTLFATSRGLFLISKMKCPAECPETTLEASFAEALEASFGKPFSRPFEANERLCGSRAQKELGPHYRVVLPL